MGPGGRQGGRPMAQVHYDKQGRILVLTLEGDNDLNIGTVGPALYARREESAADDDLWCCVITGAGSRAFSAGGNLQVMAAAGGPGRGSVWDPPPPNVITGQPLWKPLIAAVKGYLVGAGCMLALACDVRIASENAEFGIPEIQYGFPPGLGAPQRLPRTIALGPALEMLLTGDRISAQQALQWALVNRVVPQAALLDEALRVAGGVTADPPPAGGGGEGVGDRGGAMSVGGGVWGAGAGRITANPPLAVRATKELVYRGLTMSVEDGIRMSGLVGTLSRETADAQEGLRAFKEKRKPEFQGR